MNCQKFWQFLKNLRFFIERGGQGLPAGENIYIIYIYFCGRLAKILPKAKFLQNPFPSANAVSLDANGFSKIEDVKQVLRNEVKLFSVGKKLTQ